MGGTFTHAWHEVNRDYLSEATSWYEEAEEPSTDRGNDGALLRWNTCARCPDEPTRTQDASAGAIFLGVDLNQPLKEEGNDV
jgi:hypothetical protein